VRAADTRQAIYGRKRAGFYFCVLICAYWTGLINGLLFGQPEGEEAHQALADGTLFGTLFNGLVVVSGLALTIKYLFSGEIKYGKYCWFLAICLLCVASTFWSISPDITLKRSLTLLGSVMLLIFFIEKVGTERLMLCFVQQFLIIAVISLFGRVFMKEWVVFSGTHDLKGIYSHKNEFGAMMSVATLCALFLAIRRDEARSRFLRLAVFFMGCNILSFSTTAILQGLSYLTIATLYLKARRGGLSRMTAIVASVLLVLATGATVVEPDILFAISGKDSTLTGRTDLWPIVIEEINVRPWFGWGFKGFWVPGQPEAEEIWRNLTWSPPHAHNGALEIALSLGYFGVALIALFLLRNFVMALQNLRVGNRDAGILGIMAFVAIVIYGTTEGTILGGDLHALMYFVPTMYGTYEYWKSRGKNRAVEPVTKFGLSSAHGVTWMVTDIMHRGHDRHTSQKMGAKRLARFFSRIEHE
jgi:exopolysaccharide production protein ExoQ